MLEQFQLTDQVAIVTGGGKGIGAATVALFAQAGADVVVTARTVEDVALVAKSVEGHGRRSIGVPGDVDDLGFLAELVQRTVDELGGIDIVVNNAGGSVSRPLLDTTVADLSSRSTSTSLRRSSSFGWRCRTCSIAAAAPS